MSEHVQIVLFLAIIGLCGAATLLVRRHNAHVDAEVAAVFRREAGKLDRMTGWPTDDPDRRQ